ncbi:MAG: nucleotidyltransferase domain-containing protein [Pseudomonadota bacterium]
MNFKNCNKNKLTSNIIQILGKHLNLEEFRVFYFGSRVSGKGSERSDIDVGLLGTLQIPIEKMEKIKEDIENLPYLYKIELVDFTQVSEEFKKVAMQNIEEIKIND